MPNKKDSVSVVIVTKNRAQDLLQCIGSLLSQSEMIDELIVVDNNSSDNTSQLVKNIKKFFKLKIRLIKEDKSGYPQIYNRGLREASHDWVAFIDDDCVADINWHKNLKAGIRKLKNNEAVLLGRSETYYKNNLFSLATLFFDKFWKQKNIDKSGKVIDGEILDNKNIVYGKDFLIANNLRYDEERSKDFNGASEDCDLGMQIYEAGGKAIFCESMLICHKDPTSLTHFIKKMYFSALGHHNYEKKWQSVRKQSIIGHNTISRFKIILTISAEKKLSAISLLLLIVIIFVGYLSKFIARIRYGLLIRLVAKKELL